MQYKIGDKVRSVGGFFIEGEVMKVVDRKFLQILTIHWTKHKDKGNIDLMQERSSSIVEKVE